MNSDLHETRNGWPRAPRAGRRAARLRVVPQEGPRRNHHPLRRRRPHLGRRPLRTSLSPSQPPSPSTPPPPPLPPPRPQLTPPQCEGTGISAFAAEPTHQGADDLRRGLATSTRIPAVSTLTIADGLRTPVGALPWTVLHDRGLLRGAYAVSEEDISRALRLVLERLKVVVEPSAVVGLAVVLFNEEFRGLVEREGGREGWDVGVVFTGGNLSMEALPGLLKLGDGEAR